VGKLISKVLANRLAPRLAELIHCSQSAFLKGRCIQYNFRFVQSSAKLLHARRLPCLLFKADISRVIDSVTWPFLLEILGHVGFLSVWLNWISALLSTASTKILMNGLPRGKICHARGLCQADPISPMLFLLVMEVLSCLIQKADAIEGPGYSSQSFLLHGDIILIVCPRSPDLQLLRKIFDIFHGASGLECNMSKCQLAPIRCSSEQVQMVTDFFPCQVVNFLIKYLGIPLSTTKLPKSAFQPLVDSCGQIANLERKPYESERETGAHQNYPI
jgi:hypothetical protein